MTFPGVDLNVLASVSSPHNPQPVVFAGYPVAHTQQDLSVHLRLEQVPSTKERQKVMYNEKTS